MRGVACRDSTDGRGVDSSAGFNASATMKEAPRWIGPATGQSAANARPHADAEKIARLKEQDNMTDPMRLANAVTRAHFENVLNEEEARRIELLREAGADVWFETNDGGHAEAVHDSRDPAQQTFELPLVTTDDDHIVAAITNQIETEPWQFAVRFLLLERSHAILAGEVDKLRETVTRLSYWSH